MSSSSAQAHCYPDIEVQREVTPHGPQHVKTFELAAGDPTTFLTRRPRLCGDRFSILQDGIPAERMEFKIHPRPLKGHRLRPHQPKLS